MNWNPQPLIQRAPLMRGSIQITNLFSVFGDVKETTLTACLGYLISEYPQSIGHLFNIKNDLITKVIVELKENDTDRYDVAIETQDRLILLEAKVGFKQFSRQITRYISNQKDKKKVTLYLLDNGSYKSNGWIGSLKRPENVTLAFMTWAELHKGIKKILENKSARQNLTAWGVGHQFLKYLETNMMADQMQKEIYVRDMSGESISLLFKELIYKCQPQFYASAVGNHYFAPYFTTKAPQDFSKESLIRIEKGISWMFPIRSIQTVQKNKVREFLKSEKHPNPIEAARKILKGHHYKDVLILMLGEPFLAFLTPISKKKLGIKGSMGSRCFTFENFFNVASRGE